MEGVEERPNVSRSAVESGETARDEAPSATAGGCLSPRWKCDRLHGSECSAETEADERPLIAVSAGNFNIANPKGITNKIGCVIENCYCFIFLKFQRNNQ